MNRNELLDAVATRAETDRKVADKLVRALTDTLMAQAQAGEKVSIFGFGTFTPTSRDARMGRNPQTGEAVQIAASRGVRFAPSTAFKSAMNPAGATKKAAASTKKTAKAAPAKAAKKIAKAADAPAKKAAKKAKKA